MYMCVCTCVYVRVCRSEVVCEWIGGFVTKSEGGRVGISARV